MGTRYVYVVNTLDLIGRVTDFLVEPSGEDLPWLIALDGLSGSGKSTLAQGVQEIFPRAQVLHLDDLYPGWDGLGEGARRAAELVRVWTDGESPTFTPTRWPGMAPRPDITIDAARPLIVEGVGAAWAVSNQRNAHAFFLHSGEAVRKAQALERDGATYEPHWDAWARAETEWFARHPLSPKVQVISVGTR